MYVYVRVVTYMYLRWKFTCMYMYVHEYIMNQDMYLFVQIPNIRIHVSMPQQYCKLSLAQNQRNHYSIHMPHALI